MGEGGAAVAVRRRPVRLLPFRLDRGERPGSRVQGQNAAVKDCPRRANERSLGRAGIGEKEEGTRRTYDDVEKVRRIARLREGGNAVSDSDSDTHSLHIEQVKSGMSSG